MGVRLALVFVVAKNMGFVPPNGAAVRPDELLILVREDFVDDVIGRIRIPSLRREDFKIDRKHCSSALKASVLAV